MYTDQGNLNRDAAIEKYAPLVQRMANQLAGRLPSSVDIGDLIQAGMLGLMDALSRFDENAGAQFATFASQRIRGSMLDELRKNDWLSRSSRRSQRDITEAISQVEQRILRAPTETEIAAELDLTITQYHKLLNDSRGTQLIYLDDIGDSAESGSFLDRYDPEQEPDLLKMLHGDQFREALSASIGELPEREQHVMSMYYEHDLTLKEIGAVLEVTESRISQLHSQAISRIRSRMTDWIEPLSDKTPKSRTPAKQPLRRKIKNTA